MEDANLPLRALIAIGTRPEAIKLAPVIHACRDSFRIAPLVYLTGQQQELVLPMIDHFELQPCSWLDVEAPDQSLAGFAAACLSALDREIAQQRPDCLIAQGDTTTVAMSALAAFYRQVPFVHVEAGLRTGDLQSPFPEECHRRMATLMTSLHCAPTAAAVENLRREQVAPEAILLTGNTVVDALQWTIGKLDSRPVLHSSDAERLVLVTCHRRENWKKIPQIAQAVTRLAGRFPKCDFLLPLHSNPRVRNPFSQLLTGYKNIYLTEPLEYPELVRELHRCCLVLTDSGGIQEEAYCLGKPTLVLRETTERPEVVDSALARLVGTNPELIFDSASQLLTGSSRPQLSGANPFGDGNAARRIVAGLIRHLDQLQSEVTSARFAAADQHDRNNQKTSI